MTKLHDASYGRIEQAIRNLAAAGFQVEDLNDPEALRRLRQLWQGQIAPVGRFYPERDYSQFDQHLNSLADQLGVLRDLNKLLPQELRLQPEWLDIDLSGLSGHVQSVRRLRTFHIEFDSLEQNWVFTQEITRLRQGRVYDPGFARDARSMRLNASAFRYTHTGIHVVDVNLVDHWDPQNQRTLAQARTRAMQASQHLASTEAIEAYALQRKGLVRLQDGTNLPYIDCGGIEQGDDFGHAPFVCWLVDGVYFDVSSASYAYRDYAAPSVAVVA